MPYLDQTLAARAARSATETAVDWINERLEELAPPHQTAHAERLTELAYLTLERCGAGGDDWGQGAPDQRSLLGWSDRRGDAGRSYDLALGVCERECVRSLVASGRGPDPLDAILELAEHSLEARPFARRYCRRRAWDLAAAVETGREDRATASELAEVLGLAASDRWADARAALAEIEGVL